MNTSEMADDGFMPNEIQANRKNSNLAIAGNAPQKQAIKTSPDQKQPVHNINEDQAIRAWGSLAESGDIVAELCLARALISSSVDVHRKKAVECLFGAAIGGHPEAVRIIKGWNNPSVLEGKAIQRATKLLHKMPLNFDPIHLVSLMRVLAEDGSSEAAYTLVVELINSESAAERAEALKWLEVAGKGGHAQAQYLLGRWHFSGYLLPADLSAAVEWSTKAADQGHVEACTFLGTLYMDRTIEVDVGKADKYLTSAAESGSEFAMINLACLAIYGLRPEKFKGEAEGWLRRAAARGNSGAMVNLGNLLLKSEDVENQREGLSLLEKAARSGDVPALYHLASEKLERATNSLEQTEIFRLFERAAAENYVPAIRGLAFCYVEGVGIEKNPQMAMKLFQEAMEKGDSMAAMNLGAMHFNGIGVSIDQEKGLALIKEAARLGCVEAIEVVKQLVAKEGASNV